MTYISYSYKFMEDQIKSWKNKSKNYLLIRYEDLK